MGFSGLGDPEQRGDDQRQKGPEMGEEVRMLRPQAQSTAKMASPAAPLSGHRARRPSFFMWPISGSMALRHPLV